MQRPSVHADEGASVGIEIIKALSEAGKLLMSKPTVELLHPRQGVVRLHEIDLVVMQYMRQHM